MKRIVVLTASRAEYGLLRPLILKLGKEEDIDMRLAVTGSHLSPEFGMTVCEIEEDGIEIDKKTEILLSADTPVSISKSMGLAMISFAEYFAECDPDALIVLGDRFETLAVCCAAMNAGIPVLHLHGGETTEGLIDEAIRHSITKMSYLHFASTENYRQRIIQMGEAPERVFNVGAIGVENALHTQLHCLKSLEKDLQCDLGGCYVVGTFHPVTLEKATAQRQTEELLGALNRNPQITYLFTKANADSDGRIINKMLKRYAQEHDNFILVDSLGTKRYMSALKYASFVIGNSSSGLIEAPSFGIPTINIGDRQRGRIAGESVINCRPEMEDIDLAIKTALSDRFKDIAGKAENPYGEGDTSEKIIRIMKEFLNRDKVDMKKKFHDIRF